MKIFKALGTFLLLGFLLATYPSTSKAQSYDLLLKGGHLIDPKNGIDSPMDIAIADGKVAKVGKDLPSN